MKTKFIKRGMSGLMAVLMAVTAFVGLGTTTAFAASETAESYMVSYPRDGDANQVYGEDGWGHTAKTYMNGWSTGSSRVLTLHCMDSYDGKVCYCIEPGVVRNVGDTYTKFNENFWDMLLIRTVSSPLRIMFAVMIGLSRKSNPLKAICLIMPLIMSVRKLSFTP